MYNKCNGIYYECIENTSSKENLVFVHGSGCNHTFLQPLAKQLGDYNCYLLDLPDHGKSENRTCTRAEDYVTAVADFVSQLDNVTIIGHSLGGTLCLGVAAQQLPSVKANVIISSAAKFYKFDKEILDMVDKQEVNWPYLIQCCSASAEDVWIQSLNFEPPDVMIRDFTIDIMLDFEDVLRQIHTPTLIMVGGDDFLTVPEYSVKMYEAIEDAELIIVPNNRHLLPIAESALVAQSIRKFLVSKVL